MRTWNCRYLYDGPAIERNLRYLQDPELTDGDAALVYCNDPNTGKEIILHMLYRSSSTKPLNLSTQPYAVPCPAGGTWVQYGSPISVTQQDGFVFLNVAIDKNTQVESILYQTFAGTVISTTINIISPFPDGTTVRIGSDLEKSKLLGNEHVSPVDAETFVGNQMVPWDDSTPIKLFFNPTNRLSGSGKIFLQLKPY